ncbi:polysaccharide pyruvyl transferase family protein, partial [Bacillus sp. JJ1566]|uniref:polysaccharide pyruvyl transferase family protein n=1 Tax=Bacillus sp. JJ1566 TaxID=3122961 RepID=UPI002FFFF509
MKKITLLDTSICTENNGDKIIMDSINREINNIHGDFFQVNLPTHDKIGINSYKHIMSSDLVYACGTNMLSSNMWYYNQWKINMVDSFFLKDVILLGVGWWQYQRKPDLYTKILLKRVLNSNIIHSVRDSYTENMLKSIGINNVTNTSCPTMWNLTPEHCENIPTVKSSNVLLTLTNYNKDPKNDKKLIDILQRNYKNIYFWIQAHEDKEYIESLVNTEGIRYVGPSLKALDSLLQNNSMALDFVGTRLHAGIRALQNKRRTIIIGIDNR